MGSKMGQIDRIGDLQWRAAEQDDEQWMKDKAAGAVERWNAALASGRGALWSPTMRAAVMAGRPWLDVYSPGCHAPAAEALRCSRVAGLEGLKGSFATGGLDPDRQAQRLE